MARAGQELTSAVFERIVFRKTSADTNGELLEVEAVYHPNSTPPPEHYHPRQEERFQVRSGAVRTVVDGVERVYSAGESFVVPAGSRHLMHNAGDDQAHVVWQTLPALKTEAFFETVWELAAQGKMGHGMPNPLLMAVLMREFQDEFRLAKPSFRLQRLAFGALAPVGGLLGYRALLSEIRNAV